MKVSHRESQLVHDLYEKIEKLEEENKHMRAVLEDGSSGLGLAPAECQEVLNRFPKKDD